MIKFVQVVSVLLISALAEYVQAASAPEQIHIAMAGAHAMRIMWFTNETTHPSICKFGISSIDESSVRGSAETYLENYGSHHVVLIDNLKSGTKYQYSVGDGTTMSETLEFTTMPSESTDAITLAVFGDMGYLDSVAVDRLRAQGQAVSSLHLRFIQPMPSGIGGGFAIAARTVD